MNLQYFYLPVLPSNRFSLLNAVVDEIPAEKNVFILVKNEQLAQELSRFFLLRGVAAFFVKKETVSLIDPSMNMVGIVSYDNSFLLKGLSFTHLISTISSFSIKDCKDRFSLFSSFESEQVIIELIGRLDYQLLQSIKQNIMGITINKMILSPTEEETKKNRMNRLNQYINRSVPLQDDEANLGEKYATMIAHMNEQEIRKTFAIFLKNIVHSAIPSFDFYFEKNNMQRVEEEIKVAISIGENDAVIAEDIKQYFLRCSTVTEENVGEVIMFPNKSVITMRAIAREIIEQYIEENLFMGKTLFFEITPPLQPSTPLHPRTHRYEGTGFRGNYPQKSYQNTPAKPAWAPQGISLRTPSKFRPYQRRNSYLAPDSLQRNHQFFSAQGEAYQGAANEEWRDSSEGESFHRPTFSPYQRRYQKGEYHHQNSHHEPMSRKNTPQYTAQKFQEPSHWNTPGQIPGKNFYDEEAKTFSNYRTSHSEIHNREEQKKSQDE